ncbi:MAG: peptide-methionine (R)-S-oxide reductase MsrB [Bryobacteraceae bacterium]
MHRRAFLIGTAGTLASCVGGADSAPVGAKAGETFEVTKSEAQWRKVLTPTQFRILRESDTERQGASPLNDEHREGVYHCAGCGLPLYSASAKFESGTGWPSFTQPIPAAIRTSVDRGLLGTRTEVHCRRCGGHLGHVFEDGPPPTGRRYCMNGGAMIFKPTAQGA